MSTRLDVCVADGIQSFVTQYTIWSSFKRNCCYCHHSLFHSSMLVWHVWISGWIGFQYLNNYIHCTELIISARLSELQSGYGCLTMRVPPSLRRVVLLALICYFASRIYVSFMRWQNGQVGTLMNTRGSATVQARYLSFECAYWYRILQAIAAKCPQFISRCSAIQMTDLSIVPCHYCLYIQKQW